LTTTDTERVSDRPGALDWLDRWLLEPGPPERLAALRILVGGYALVWLLARLPAFVDVLELPARQFQPIGVLFWMDEPVRPAVGVTILVATIVTGVAFVAGYRFRWFGPLFSLLFLVITTYRLCWGHVLHTDHLVVLHLLVLGFTGAARAWSVDTRHLTARDPEPRFGWPVKVMAVITVTSYVLAGWAKLRNGGVDWLMGDVLRNQVAYDNLRKVLIGDVHSPIGGWVVRYDDVFPPVAMATVLVELGAPIALLGGRWRTAWVFAAWGFHVGILLLMAIMFPYPLSFVAYAPLFRTERLFTSAGAWWHRRRRGG